VGVTASEWLDYMESRGCWSKVFAVPGGFEMVTPVPANGRVPKMPDDVVIEQMRRQNIDLFEQIGISV
jgi:hypothetical protein